MSGARITSIVLAAGAGRRFGGRKQLAVLGGRPLVEHALAAATADGRAALLVLGADGREIEARLRLGDTAVVHCRDWERGPGASLSCGLAALGPEVEAALVTLGDEPFVSPEASRRLIAARREGMPGSRATYGGRPGHPVLIERRLFAPLIAAPREEKPATLLREAGIVPIECGDLGDPADVDTPEQLAALEEYRRA